MRWTQPKAVILAYSCRSSGLCQASDASRSVADEPNWARAQRAIRRTYLCSSATRMSNNS